MTVTQLERDPVEKASTVYNATLNEAKTLRQRVVEGDTDVTGLDLAEADSRAELARLRLEAAQRIRDEQSQQVYERDREAFIKRVQELRRRREGKLAKLSARIGGAIGELFDEAEAYDSERHELAGQADYYGVTDLPGPARAIALVLDPTEKALRSHPLAARTGLAADLGTLTYRARSM